MIKSKLLNESAWKDVLAKNKGVKDNGLLKTLAEIKKLGDDDHDDAQEILDQIQKLAAQLKKSKEIAGTPAVGKFLAELTGAADTAVREVAKAKVEADKKTKAEADAKKREQEDKAKSEDEDEDEDGESSVLLTTKLVPLLRQVAKGQTMHTLVAKSGKQVVVMLSRKPIPPARRKLLAEQLGGGSTKYYPGHCTLENGATTFALKAEVAGMAKLIKAALLEQTGLRLNKVKCRGEDGDDDDEDDVVVAKGGAPEEDEEGDAETGDDGVPEFVPGVDINAPLPELAKAPEAWNGTRDLLQTSIDSLKDAVRSQVADEGQDLIVEIDGHLGKLDRILSRLDRRLTDSLASAAETQDPSARRLALQESKIILTEYIQYVRSEPLIEHLDRNPFGVKTDLKATLSKSLTKMARAIG